MEDLLGLGTGNTELSKSGHCRRGAMLGPQLQALGESGSQGP